MNASRIAVIDDEPRICRLLEIELNHTGYQVRCAGEGSAGLELVRNWQPDLVLLDVMMPHLDGVALLPLLRRVTHAPIIIVSAKNRTADKVLGLRNGADFYLSKPFEMAELSSLVGAALRRRSFDRVECFLSFHDLKLNAHDRSAERSGVSIHLTSREFDLLSTLVREPRRVFSREELLGRIWGNNGTNLGVVDTHISSVRRKVDRAFEEPLIYNVRGAGYCVRRRGSRPLAQYREI